MLKIILILIFPFSILAQSSAFQFRLEGTFPMVTGDPTLPTTPETPVNFTLSWNERDGLIEGVYADNFFSSGNPVEGRSDTAGRTFNIIFSNLARGAKSMTMFMTQTGVTTGSVPVSVDVMDSVGNRFNSQNISGLMSATPTGTAAATDSSCVLGFGDLSRFCGIYSGTVTESTDTKNRCQSIVSDNTVLNLDTEGDFQLYMNFNGNLDSNQVHELGSLPTAAPTRAVNIVNRDCGTALAGTTMTAVNCKTLNLVGNFTEDNGRRGFSGIYSIIDEVNGDTCRYNLSLTRTVTY